MISFSCSWALRKSDHIVALAQHKLANDVLHRGSSHTVVCSISNALPQQHAFARILLLRKLQKQVIETGIRKDLKKQLNKHNKKKKTALHLRKSLFERTISSEKRFELDKSRHVEIRQFAAGFDARKSASSNAAR